MPSLPVAGCTVGRSAYDAFDGAGAVIGVGTEGSRTSGGAPGPRGALTSAAGTTSAGVSPRSIGSVTRYTYAIRCTAVIHDVTASRVTMNIST
jgi:hypothetical protein